MRLLIDIPTKKVMDGEEISVSGILYLESNLVGTSIYFAFPGRISILPNCGDLVDRDALSREMYHEAFETDSALQKWDSGCWVRYKMFEKHRDAAPVVIPAERSEE